MTEHLVNTTNKRLLLLMKTQETECSAALKTNDTTWQVLIITIEFVIGLLIIKELIRYDSAPACKKSQPVRAISEHDQIPRF